MRRLAAIILLAATAIAEPKGRSWQLSEINARIADLQRQLEYWQEKKRRLLDQPIPEVHTGPRNGRYHYSPSGKKVYERK